MVAFLPEVPDLRAVVRTIDTARHRGVPAGCILEVDLQTVPPETASFDPLTLISGGGRPLLLRDAVSAVHRAAKDDRVAGLIARVQFSAAPPAAVQELREAVAAYRDRPGGVRLVTELGDNLPILPLDREQMRRALVNLVENASESMPGGGTITVSTARRLRDDADPQACGQRLRRHRMAEQLDASAVRKRDRIKRRRQREREAHRPIDPMNVHVPEQLARPRRVRSPSSHVKPLVKPDVRVNIINRHGHHSHPTM